MPKVKAEIRDSSPSTTSDEKSISNDDGESSTDYEDVSPFKSNSKKVFSSTQIVNPKENLSRKTQIKKKLINHLQGSNVAHRKHTAAVRNIKWDSIQIDDFTTEELQNSLSEIIKSAGTSRTLHEILNDYESNWKKYEISNHPDFPSRPHIPSMQFFMVNRSKFEQKLEKENGGKKVAYRDVYKYGMQKFRELPEKKKQGYIDTYAANQEAFKEIKKQFFKDHPELKIGKSDSVSSRAGKKDEVFKSTLLLTPFHHYREKLFDEGTRVDFATVQKMWKELPILEKGKYIAEVADMDTDKEKRLSKEELKILDQYQGLPSRPISLYQLFCKKLFEETSKRKVKKTLTQVAEEWKKISKEEKSKLQNEVDKYTEEWREKMEAYIQKMPKDQQPMLRSKYNLYKFDQKHKRKITDSTNSLKSTNAKNDGRSKLSFDDDSDQEEFPMPKKIKKENGSPSLNDSDSSKVQTSSVSKEKSPLKSPKKQKLNEPVYPSQTTAHYYMTKIYDGKPSKVIKAYKKLDAKDKRMHRATMIQLRKQFLDESAAYVKNADPTAIVAFQLNIKKSREAQKEEITWHIDTGTDKESKKYSSSSDSSSSDSDSS
ncbi:CLUMA_CG014161, isoform A [Clunio marinus]|uniref:CLUMA_CG014161, isoform A n=1 Tax=Clunio marinus TaxID=568069 RepID=A0A1J1ILM0_9DIPT|nr:CLUMA_CG014161, isoform A [Clunio marinus]